MLLRFPVVLQKYARVCVEKVEHTLHELACCAIDAESRIRGLRHLSKKLQFPSQTLLRPSPICQDVTQQNQACWTQQEPIQLVYSMRRREITHRNECQRRYGRHCDSCIS